MKKNNILLLLLSIGLSLSMNAQFWINSLEGAKKLALIENKLILLDFTASWCGPCKKMDRETWTDLLVKKEMDNFINVKIDIDIDKETASFYGVRSIPNILIVDANGEILFNETGYKDKTKMKSVLKKHALNTLFVKAENIAYSKNKNFKTTLRLANKYQILSVKTEQFMKKKLLNLSYKYLKKTSKLLKTSKSKNKAYLNQKIALLKIRKSAILNKSKKTLKKLKKIKEPVLEKNKSLFAFLNYISYSQLKDADNSAQWKSQMNASDKTIAKIVLNEK